MYQLYTKQQEHADRLILALDKWGSALDASSTGCGKTLVGAEIAKVRDLPTRVVCLKNSIPMWEEELQARGVRDFEVINYDMLRTGRTKWGSWDDRQFDFNLPKKSFVVWDEVQKCQGIDTKNSKTLIGAKSFDNLMLSASAVENPSEMRALGYVLGLHQLRDFIPWCKARGCKMNQWRGWDFRDPSGAILDRLHHEIFPEHGSRLSVKDLAEHFKETQIITTPLDFGDGIQTIYAEMEAELAVLKETAKGDSKNLSARRIIARLRGRQRAELCKVPTLIEMAEDLLKEGRSVVIFVNFNATIEAILKRMPTTSIIRGANSKEHKAVMQGFQADESRFLICNIKAGGISINLHDTHGNHPRTSLISPSDDAKEILQVIGRIHRAGGATPSQQHVLFAAKTVEVPVERNCREKIRNMEIFNDGLPDKTVDALA